MTKKRELSRQEKRRLRGQQIIFAAIGVIIIISFVLSLIAR
jgi:predicted nucleic acid-binding Zn ribbon protein